MVRRSFEDIRIQSSKNIFEILCRIFIREVFLEVFHIKSHEICILGARYRMIQILKLNSFLFSHIKYEDLEVKVSFKNFRYFLFIIFR